MNKKFCVVACVAISIFAAVGCGSSSETTQMRAVDYSDSKSVNTGAFTAKNSGEPFDEAASKDVAESEGFVVEEALDETEANENESVPDTSRKLITTMNIGAETEQFDEALSMVEGKAKELGGYIELSEVYNGSIQNENHSNSNRRASFVIRIPADKLETFVDGLSGACNITNRTTNVEDVTLQYVDLESKKKALLTEEESLLKILESANTVEDIITVQDRLSQVRYELENMESQLRTYDNQVDYSTVNLDVLEVAKYTAVEGKGAFQRMGEGFVESLFAVGHGIKEFIVLFVIYIPQLLCFAILVAIALFGAKKYRKMRACKEEKTTVTKTEGEDGK